MTKDILEKMNLRLESENFELRLELERANSDTPRLREKVDHLEKYFHYNYFFRIHRTQIKGKHTNITAYYRSYRYIKLLKAEKSSDSTPRSSDKDLPGSGTKKSIFEMEKTIFTLKRIIEKLQAENKRLKFSSKKNHFLVNQVSQLFSLILHSICLPFAVLDILRSHIFFGCRERQVSLKETLYFIDNMRNLRNV